MEQAPPSGTGPRRIVATWYYEQGPDEGGTYAQMRGDSSSERYRDVYRRCIAVFFVTARIANPDSDLVLVVNQPWRPNASLVAAKTQSLLESAGVELVVTSYSFAPPRSWPTTWRNQFFVFDALEAIRATTGPHDLIMLLDSDVIWTDGARAAGMWGRFAEAGSLTLELDYAPDRDVNGLTRREMTLLAADLGLDTNGVEALAYVGGELVGLSSDAVGLVCARARRVWPRVVERFEAATFPGMDEAHLLSMLYADLDISTGNANSFVKRLWTQPFRYRNVLPEDEKLALWHVPAEKRYGLRRLFDAVSDWTPAQTPSWATAHVLGRYVGIPKNTPAKVLRDTTSAVVTRGRSLHERVGGSE